jgi:ABC-type nitrate/sulfonate/bicarbonate transport system ATPase subunit
LGACAVRLIDVAKSYHRDGHVTPVVSGIDLSAEEGEILALLGPSGCGKSTLLRAVAGLEPIDGGRVEFGDGVVHQSLGKSGRHPEVGIVFQDPLLLPWLTVAENVALGLGYRANREAAKAESIDQVLADFGLAQVANAYPTALSGGQAQRTSLARTVVTRPRILLLDEPFAALDPRTRRALQDWLLELAARRHLTVVIVTHDVDEAIYLGNRVILMSGAPGTILREWEIRGPGDSLVGRRTDRGRRDEVRPQILALYQTDVTVGSESPDWVI